MIGEGAMGGRSGFGLIPRPTGDVGFRDRRPCSRMVGTLLLEFRRRGQRWCMVTICVRAWMGAAALLEAAI